MKFYGQVEDVLDFWNLLEDVILEQFLRSLHLVGSGLGGRFIKLLGVEHLEVDGELVGLFEEEELGLVVDSNFRRGINLTILSQLGVLLIHEVGKKEELELAALDVGVNFDVFELAVAVLNFLPRGSANAAEDHLKFIFLFCWFDDVEFEAELLEEFLDAGGAELVPNLLLPQLDHYWR